MKYKFRHFALLSLVFILIGACSEEPDCDLEQPYDVVNIVFYDLETEDEDRIKFDQVVVSGSDSIFYDRADTLSRFQLPLNPSTDTVAFFFLTGLITDSIVIKYDRKLDWLSEECGPFFSYDNLMILAHSFDSLNFEQPIIDRSVDENIQIFND